MRVGVLTGGGDCPGLNAVIRAIVRKAERLHGAEVVGFLDGWAGVVERRTMPLDIDAVFDRDDGTMVSLRADEIVRVPLADVVGGPKPVSARLYEDCAQWFFA